MAVKKVKESPFLTYKGKPLVRCGDTIYYGNMSDPFVVKMQIETKKKVNNNDVADKISVQLLSTDTDISKRKQIIKTSEKNGLYLAMDIADVWLDRAMKDMK